MTNGNQILYVNSICDNIERVANRKFTIVFIRLGLADFFLF